VATNIATERPASDHASHTAARVPIWVAPAPCSFVPSVTTPLYRTIVAQTLRLALRGGARKVGAQLDHGNPHIASSKYEETIQFGWSTISEILKSATRFASTYAEVAF